MPSHGKRAASLRAAMACIRVLRLGLLVDGRQNDEALLVLLDEAVHALVFILVEAHFLPDRAQVEADRRVAYHHLEAQFAHFLSELLDLLSALLVPIVDRESLLDRLGQPLQEHIRHAALHYLTPVRLIALAQHALYRVVQLGQAAHLQKDLLRRGEMLLDGIYYR